MARLCLALLRNSNSCLQIVQEAVRNFDMVSYHRGNPRGFPLFFVVACKRCYYIALVPQWWVAWGACTHCHPPLHHATFGGTLATITLTACIGGSATHLNIGGCADRVESIARPLVYAIMYPRELDYQSVADLRVLLKLFLVYTLKCLLFIHRLAVA